MRIGGNEICHKTIEDINTVDWASRTNMHLCRTHAPEQDTYAPEQDTYTSE